jgi:hypothetical protein
MNGVAHPPADAGVPDGPVCWVTKDEVRLVTSRETGVCKRDHRKKDFPPCP